MVVVLIGAVSADVSHLFDNSNGYNYQKPQGQFDDGQQRPTQNYLPPNGQQQGGPNGQLPNGRGGLNGPSGPSGPSAQNGQNGQNGPNAQNGPSSNVNQRYLPPNQFGTFRLRIF